MSQAPEIQPEKQESERWPPLHAWIAIVAATLLAHGSMLSRQLLWDDLVLLDQMDLTGRWRLFDPDAFGFVRPGKTFMFSSLDALFGRSALGWELFGLFCVCAAAILVYRLGRHFVSPAAALSAALIYAVHPLHVEGAGWAAANNGTVLTIFAIGYYLLVLGKGRHPAPPVLALMTFLFLGALFMKEEAAVLPLIALIALLAAHIKVSRSMVLALGFQLFLAAVFMVFVRWKAREVGQQLDQLPVQPWLVSLSAPRSILSHFLYFFLPFRWAYFTTYNTSPVPFIAMTAAGLAAAGSCIFWLWRSRLRPGPAWFFLLFAIVALLPASNLLPLGNKWFGVRYLTHAGVGLALLLGHAVYRIGLVRPDLRRALRLSLLVWLIAAALQSNRFHILWRTEESFFTTMIGVNDNRLFNEALAKLRRRQGQFSEAEALARHAIELDPESIGPRMTLGIALQRQDRLEEAVAEWRAVEALEPGNVDMAVSLATYYYEPLYQRTRDPGDLEKADRYYRIGCTGATPNAEIAYNNRGRLWAVEGNLEKAIGIWNEGLLKFPGSLSIGPNLERASRELQDRQAGETPPP